MPCADIPFFITTTSNNLNQELKRLTCNDEAHSPDFLGRTRDNRIADSHGPLLPVSRAPAGLGRYKSLNTQSCQLQRGTLIRSTTYSTRVPRGLTPGGPRSSYSKRTQSHFRTLKWVGPMACQLGDRNRRRLAARKKTCATRHRSHRFTRLAAAGVTWTGWLSEAWTISRSTRCSASRS
jgi:hypothetical protein